MGTKFSVDQECCNYYACTATRNNKFKILKYLQVVGEVGLTYSLIIFEEHLPSGSASVGCIDIICLVVMSEAASDCFIHLCLISQLQNVLTHLPAENRF